MSDIAIKCENICKKYSPNEIALHESSITLRKGEMVAVVGPSGSGKSTLLHIAGSLERSDAGSVHISGYNLYLLKDNDLSQKRGQMISFVYQFHHLMPELSALENVTLPLIINGNDEQKSINEAKQALETLNIAHLAKKYPHQLSGGEKQRVSIARAIVGKDKVAILADEPTGNLDSHNATLAWKLLHKITRTEQKAVIVATHDLNLAKTADRIITMNDGRVISDIINDNSENNLKKNLYEEAKYYL